MKIYCCACKEDRDLKETTGITIYPNRPDLAAQKFYYCPQCLNYVGVHKDSGLPLGSVPTPELRKARHHIHKLIDPLWEKNLINRSHLYNKIAKRAGIDEFHTAEIRTIEEARRLYRVCLAVKKEIMGNWNKKKGEIVGA
jgi:hypothetical protein